MILCTCGHNSTGWELANKLTKQLAVLETAMVVIANASIPETSDETHVALIDATVGAKDALDKLKALRTS